MFDKMVRMKNNKGFTLVEMLVVIAVIAILVSIVIPVVGNSVTKSRAATNAANLRAVEGQLSTLRVSNPDLFLDAVDKLGQPWDEIASRFESALGFLTTQQVQDYINYQVYTTEAVDGTLTLYGANGNSIQLTDIPAAVGVSAGGNPGMEVTEGTNMTVLITATDIVATYEAFGGAYTKDDFAEVAETGEYNGTPSGGMTEDQFACATTGHRSLTKSYVENCKCTNCGAVEHQATGNTHKCDCGKTTVTTAHKDGIRGLTADGECDYDDCDATCKTQGSGISHVFKRGSNKCEKCETECNHDYTGTYSDRCKTCWTVKSGHIHTNSLSTTKNSVCTTCGATKTSIWPVEYTEPTQPSSN